MPKQAADASSEFRIFETDEFLKRLKRLARKESDLLQRKLRDYVYPQLRDNPFLGPNIRKLKDYTPDTWRYRVGHFRIFFLVDQAARIVYVLSVDHRREVLGDPDEGLPVRKSFEQRLLRQKRSVSRGERGEAMDDVVKRLGLARMSLPPEATGLRTQDCHFRRK
jgi:mRNA interferase RelE/StbE